MTLQQLRYVIMVAETGTITEAASRLFISQPSLTNAIHELEKEMNIKIFDRTNKGIHISKDGEDFLGYARQVLEQAALLEDRYKGGNGGKQEFCVSTQHYSFAVNAFVDNKKVISYGTSSYGYDIRCADEFKVFTNINSTIVDPKDFDPASFVDVKSDVCIIPPNSFALARTVEYFRIPRNVLTVCLGKSTYARCGIIVNVTPFEPEWEGYVTLEFSNTTPLPAKIYAGEGCAQVLFFESDEPCEVSYADRGGKYQKQHGVTLPRA